MNESIDRMLTLYTGSDIHTLRSGWGETPYPCVVGHEIVGTAVRVGKKVSHVKVGDRVGVGAQSSSCLKPDCEECSVNNEQYVGLSAVLDKQELVYITDLHQV